MSFPISSSIIMCEHGNLILLASAASERRFFLKCFKKLLLQSQETVCNLVDRGLLVISFWSTFKALLINFKLRFKVIHLFGHSTEDSLSLVKLIHPVFYPFPENLRSYCICDNKPFTYYRCHMFRVTHGTFSLKCF